MFLVENVFPRLRFDNSDIKAFPPEFHRVTYTTNSDPLTRLPRPTGRTNQINQIKFYINNKMTYKIKKNRVNNNVVLHGGHMACCRL